MSERVYLGHAVLLYGQTFSSFADVESWVCRLPCGPARVEAWVDVVNQIATFFQGGSHFSESMIRCIRADKSFGMCRWSREEVDDLHARPFTNFDVESRTSYDITLTKSML